MALTVMVIGGISLLFCVLSFVSNFPMIIPFVLSIVGCVLGDKAINEASTAQETEKARLGKNLCWISFGISFFTIFITLILIIVGISHINSLIR